MESYPKIFRQAWRVSWGKRALWPLALVVVWMNTLAEVGLVQWSFNPGEPGLLVNLWRGIAATGLFSLRGLTAIGARFRESPTATAQVLLMIILLLAVLAAATWLSVVAQGAYVHNAAYADAGRSLQIAAGWRHSRRNFWRLLSLNILAKCAIAALFGALLLSLRLPWPVFAVLFLAGAVLVLWCAALLKLAVAAVILEDRRTFDAIGRALGLFTRYGKDAFGMLGTLTVVTFLSTAVLLVVVMLALIPFFLLLGISRILTFTAGERFYFYLSWLTVAAIVAFVVTIVNGLHWSAWTLSFARWATHHKSERVR
ncbi:MAG: hypothetical protein PHI63_02260 [Patescibacteria group bacterium]|nr:hypothetical protein [Patescibacteria group bacterium]